MDRAQGAASAFRELDQEAVDRVVRAMVVAGLRNAVELAQLAMEETGFGVFEDKVVKNYIATEFLYDYLKDKRSVGVVDEDPERGIEYVAEPIGVVLALTPITNPTKQREQVRRPGDHITAGGSFLSRARYWDGSPAGARPACGTSRRRPSAVDPPHESTSGQR